MCHIGHGITRERVREAYDTKKKPQKFLVPVGKKETEKGQKELRCFV